MRPGFHDLLVGCDKSPVHFTSQWPDSALDGDKVFGELQVVSVDLEDVRLVAEFLGNEVD